MRPPLGPTIVGKECLGGGEVSSLPDCYVGREEGKHEGGVWVRHVERKNSTDKERMKRKDREG